MLEIISGKISLFLIIIPLTLLLFTGTIATTIRETSTSYNGLKGPKHQCIHFFIDLLTFFIGSRNKTNDKRGTGQGKEMTGSRKERWRQRLEMRKPARPANGFIIPYCSSIVLPLPRCKDFNFKGFPENHQSQN